jgi:hypothetical protein
MDTRDGRVEADMDAERAKITGLRSLYLALSRDLAIAIVNSNRFLSSRDTRRAGSIEGDAAVPFIRALQRHPNYDLGLVRYQRRWTAHEGRVCGDDVSHPGPACRRGSPGGTLVPPAFCGLAGHG